MDFFNNGCHQTPGFRNNPFTLAQGGAGFYVRRMKRIFYLLIPLSMAVPAALHAQDAATEARLGRLEVQIDELWKANVAIQKRLTDLTSQIDSLRQAQGGPNTNYASQEDLNRLAQQLQEVDKKRQEDKELILKEIERLGKTLGTAPRKITTSPGDSSPAAGPDKGYDYVIQPGDTLSAIVQAYRVKNIKVTVDQILKGNPGLDPTKMRVGQKIFIPAP